jgi:hypothetical protein
MSDNQPFVVIPKAKAIEYSVLLKELVKTSTNPLIVADINKLIRSLRQEDEKESNDPKC